MTVTNKRLCKGTLAATEGTLYTVPASTQAVVKAITLCNKTGTDATITLKLAGTEVLYQHTLEANDTITLPFMDQVLDAGETIAGLAGTASAITYYISGKEIA